jgi:hypothetical protein
VRRFGVLALLFVSVPAWADRLIHIPVGKKIPFGEVRTSTLFEIASPENHESILGIGIGKSFDAEVRWPHFPGDRRKTTLDVSFNYLSPIVDISPGISIGMLDLLQETREGRRGYLAITWRRGVIGDAVNNSFVELTVGFLFGGTNNGFVGVQLPFTDQFRLLAEHDGIRINSGMEFRFAPTASTRLLVREGRLAVGLGFAMRF